jgi:hypothetical protein
VLSDAHRRAEHDLWIRRLERGPQARRATQPASSRSTLAQLLRANDSWPWYLLFGTMAVAVGTIGSAVYLAAMPARATAAPSAAACAVTATAKPAHCERRS